jgi:serine protease Do
MKRVLLLSLAFLLSCVSLGLAATDRSQEATTSEATVAVVAQERGSFLGVGLDEVTPDTVSRLKLKAERGAVVIDVVADSPAAKAGLQKDDVIVRWDGEQIESAIQLSRLRRETPVGRTVRLGIVRDGRETEVSVQLGERPERVSRIRPRAITPRPARSRFIRPERATREWTIRRGPVGMQMFSLTPQMAEYFGLGQRSGALVTWVDPDSLAAKAGLKAGDVILSISGETVDGPGDAWRTLRQKAGETVEIKVMRDRKEQSLTVQLEKSTATSWIIEPGDIDITIPVAPVATPMPVIELPAIPAIAPMPKIKITPMAVPFVKMTYRILI